MYKFMKKTILFLLPIFTIGGIITEVVAATPDDGPRKQIIIRGEKKGHLHRSPAKIPIEAYYDSAERGN